jgi:hypothetical protein
VRRGFVQNQNGRVLEQGFRVCRRLAKSSLPGAPVAGAALLMSHRHDGGNQPLTLATLTKAE